MKPSLLWVAMLALPFIGCKKEKETVVPADTVKTNTTICYSDLWTTNLEFTPHILPAINFEYNGKKYLPAYYDVHPEDNKVFMFDGTTWTSKDCDIPFLVNLSPFFFSIGNKGYACDFFSDRTRLYQYNITTNNWTRKADFPGKARRGIACFVIGTKAYVVGGECDDQSYTNENWEYNTVTDVWTKRQGTLLTRGYATGFSSNGKGYIVNGAFPDYLGYYARVAEYNPATNEWTTKATYPGMERKESICFMIDDKAYVGGGYHDDENGFTHLRDFYRYTPSTDSWIKVDDMPVEPYLSNGFTFDGKGYAMYASNGILKMARYSPQKCTTILQPAATPVSTNQ